MFEKIKDIVDEIAKMPEIFVSSSLEFILEPIYEEIEKNTCRYFKFAIIRNNNFAVCHSANDIIYRASCKDNNPEDYLLKVYNDLTIIKEKLLLENK